MPQKTDLEAHLNRLVAGTREPSLTPREGNVMINRHRAFDSFINTDVLQRLREHKIEKVVLAPYCPETEPKLIKLLRDDSS
jgi:hypothetical protein